MKILYKEGEQAVGIKALLDSNRFTRRMYREFKTNYYKHKYLTGKHRFIDRSKGCEKLCMVLAGYKDFLIPAVMGRLKKYASKDLDVCIITSGKWSDEINRLCEQNGWSYLSTRRNNVALAQNMAIDLHKAANYIFKLDEDIFITENYFERMFEVYKSCEKSTDYKVGVLAPLIPVNGYGHVKIIRKSGLEDVFRSLFGDIKIAAGPDRNIESSPELARFMWGEEVVLDGKKYKLPGIDEMNRTFAKEQMETEPCPIRFSIGAILFERKLWKDMNSFHVGKGSDMGKDEEQICTYCLLNSIPVLVSHNIVVGHLSFGGQNKAMREYYEEHKVLFLPPEDGYCYEGE